MNAAVRNPAAGQATSGYVLDVALRAVLLLAIFGEVVFLASRYRTRVDITGDKLYTLTDSTRSILSGLEERLLIEAYFSKDSKLSAVYREQRRELDNFLDEYVQLGKGKVVLQHFDPQEDQMIREKAERLGIQPATMSDVGDASLNIKEIWQGLRLLYGADRQEVIKLLDFRQVPWQYELEITPKIKAITVKKKPKVGLLAFATEAGGGMNPMNPYGGGGQPKGYNGLSRIVKGHYEIQNVDLNDGRLVPEEVKTLVLARPKNLTDRQKYAIDQFLMQGNTLVVLADTAEFEIGAQRAMTSRKVNYDATDAKLKLVDQLAHYGVKVEDKVVADGLAESWTTEPFLIVQRTSLGNMAQQLEYPYWFHALPADWAQLAERIAADQPGSNGGVAELAQKYRDTFKPGVETGNPMLKAMGAGPSVFWPCPVSLTEKLPEGVTGQVLLRTSPYAWAEDPPPNLSPTGFDPRAARTAVLEFRRKLTQKLTSEPRQQLGLMVHVKGAFRSFFEGKEIPPKKKPEEPKPAGGQALPDPLNDPLRGIPGATPPLPGMEDKGAAGAAPEEPAEAPKAEEPKAEAPKGDGAVEAPAEKKDGPEDLLLPATPLAEVARPGDKQGDDKPAKDAPQGESKPAEAPKAEAAQGEGATPPPEAQKPEAAPAPQEPAVQGPPAPPTAPEADKDQDPAPVFLAPPTAQILVIGDADFLRDDLLPSEMTGLSEEYGQLGPTSRSGPRFFTNMIDWIAEDQDLLALRNKTPVDRTIRFAANDLMRGERDEYVAKVKGTERVLTILNIAGPVAAILAIWLIVAIRRRAKKQMFLTSVQR